MKWTKLIELAKSYDFETESEIVNYVFESIINGQRQQARRVWKEVKENSFDNHSIMAIIADLHYPPEKIVEYLNIDIQIRDNTFIENIYYNYDYENFEKVRELLRNEKYED